VETYDRILGLIGRGEENGVLHPGVGTTTGLMRTRQENWVASFEAMAHHFRGWGLYCLAAEDAEHGNPQGALAKLTEADDSYAKALDMVPTYAKVRLNRWALEKLRAEIVDASAQRENRDASLRRGDEHIRRAEIDLTECLRRNPEDAKSHFSLAMLYARKRLDREAILHLRAAADLQPSLGSLLRSEHDFDHLASTPEYQSMVNQAREAADRVGMMSLFTDVDFPADFPATEVSPGDNTGRRIP
jgi:tetratricopeptide (TPR) repeat protein